VSVTAPIQQLGRVGVYGGGFMGSGIAETAARADLDVIVYEPHTEPLNRSRRRIAQSLDRAEASGNLTSEQAGAITKRITFTSALEDLQPAQLVLEAVTEDAEVKREAFNTIDTVLPDALLVASNTSSIPIAQLAASMSHPDRVRVFISSRRFR
jgi:3-hydroxybutyryl-CoA dehydrogenase